MPGKTNTINHPAGNRETKTTVKTYAFIWIILLFLTALTVLAAYLSLGGWSVIICLSIAAAKATCVLLFFMHLRHESRLLIKLLIPIVIITLSVFIGLTYVDIITRL